MFVRHSRLPALLAPLALAAAAVALPGPSTGLGLLGAGAASAQSLLDQGPPRVQQPQRAEPAPPPALPGLAVRRAPAPIPGDPSEALSPNAALFDAISRGDLAAVRDAVARGANLEARNVLGLTPLDAAVDQGRHEIAFFLLSARGTTSNGRGAMPPPGGAPDAPLATPPGPSPTAAAPARPRGTGGATPAAAGSAGAAATAAAAAPTGPRLWAGDGGSPVPEAGFLGFDAGRPSGATASGGADRRS